MHEVTPARTEKFHKSIKEIFSNSGHFTAREVGKILLEKYHIGDGTRQASAPRITELCEMEILEVYGKAYDFSTKKNVRVYRKVEE